MSNSRRISEAIDGYYVEAGRDVFPAAGFHVGFGSADQTLLLAKVHCFFRGGVGLGPAAADLDENEDATIAGDQIDLGWSGVDIAGKNAQTFFSEEFLGQFLALLAFLSTVRSLSHSEVKIWLWMTLQIWPWMRADLCVCREGEQPCRYDL